jgi:hypothetical protein
MLAVACGCACAFAACQSEDSSSPVNPGTGPSGGSGGTAASGGSSGGAGGAGTAGVAGAGTGGTSPGGSAGVSGSGAASGSGGAAGGGTAGGGAAGQAGSAGTGGSGTAADHVLVSEVGVLGDAAEFIEVYNPTSSAVDLSNYYLADNSAYYKVTAGPWNPQGTAGTDFLVRFPAGTSIPAAGVLVIGANPAGYYSQFGRCPNFFLEKSGAAVTCAGASVPAMTIPPNGSVGDKTGALLSNDREMVVLFRWDGAASTVQDIDYVTWGSAFDDNTRVDKTGAPGYKADTARASQKSADTGFVPDAGVVDGGASGLSIERCALETGEKLSGGNGLTGHDETSENMTATFKSQPNPSPGVKNTCLP